MSILQYDLGHLDSGQIVEITLTRGANVRLLNSSNFNNYKNNRKHVYYGGLVTKSPYRMKVPNRDYWYIIIDMKGLKGSTEASVNVL